MCNFNNILFFDFSFRFRRRRLLRRRRRRRFNPIVLHTAHGIAYDLRYIASTKISLSHFSHATKISWIFVLSNKTKEDEKNKQVPLLT